MKFVWDMDEENWENMMSDHFMTKAKVDRISDTAEIYGYCFVGSLRADILHTLDPDDCYAYSDVYALGIDDGYDVTYRGTPYSLLPSGPKVSTRCKSFEKFKESFEWYFRHFIKDDSDLLALAEMPLGDWR